MKTSAASTPLSINLVMLKLFSVDRVGIIATVYSAPAPWMAPASACIIFMSVSGSPTITTSSPGLIASSLFTISSALLMASIIRLVPMASSPLNRLVEYVYTDSQEIPGGFCVMAGMLVLFNFHRLPTRGKPFFHRRYHVFQSQGI